MIRGAASTGALVALFAGLACSSNKLDFTLPDAGCFATEHESVAGDAALQSGQEPAAFGAGAGGEDFATGVAEEPLSGGASGSSNGPTVDSFDVQSITADLVVYDPAGYQAGPDDAASWCEGGHVAVELCGSGIDEDCDGRVDEMAMLGQECEAGCMVAQLMCNTESHELVCRGLHGCEMEQAVTCGNGFLDVDEQCDPQAPGESLDTCTWRCTRPLFTRCLFGVGDSDPTVCTGNTECSWFTGACMPLVGTEGLRCPEYRVVGSTDETAFYPMLETEDDQCWVSCSEDEQCPPGLDDCYMGFCVVTL